MPTESDKGLLPFVLDASAALRVVLSPRDHRSWIAQLHSAGVVAAPLLFASETANALWKYQRAGRLDAETALRAHTQALALISHWQHDLALAAKALELAGALDHPVYDCLYLACVRRLDAELVTADTRLAGLLQRI